MSREVAAESGRAADHVGMDKASGDSERDVSLGIRQIVDRLAPADLVDVISGAEASRGVAVYIGGGDAARVHEAECAA